MSKVTALRKTRETQFYPEEKPAIEKGRAIPNVSRNSYWDFMLQMEIGDNFFIDKNKFNLERAVNAARSRAKALNIGVRSLREDNGIRVWRTK